MPTGPFGLSENPFVEGHDARFVYTSRAHREVVARLRRGIENREPFVLVTGLSGAGKTIAVQAALAEAAPHTLVLIAAPPSLGPAKFRERILSGFAPDGPAQATPVRSAAGIEARLLAVHARGRMALLVVDEAQNLGLPLLEELRVLSDLEADGRNLLQIILAGQPRLEDDLSRPGGDALRQRIAVRCRLGLLSPEETGSYLRHRLSVAGGDSPSLFTSESCEALHRLTHGIPREINLLAGEALILADAANESAITARHIAGAAELLGFRSVVRDSWRTRGAAKPVAVETLEVVPPADTDLGSDECEGPAAGDSVSPAISLPAPCEAPPAGPANESALVGIVPSAPAPPEAAPVSGPPESPVVELESVVLVPSGISPPARICPVSPAVKATPARLESPEADAWLARFRGPDGPPIIGSRLAVTTTVFEALEPRTADNADELSAGSALPQHAGARRGLRPRRRATRGGRLRRTVTSIAGALLLLAVGGLVLATSGRSLVRARPSIRVANEAAVRAVDRSRIMSASVARPSLVSVPATGVPTRTLAQAVSATATATAATSPSAPEPSSQNYGVEVANFIVESRAVEERERLAALISLPCRIAASFEDGAQIYSIVVGPVASLEEAARLSEDLSKRRLVGQARVVRWAVADSTRR